MSDKPLYYSSSGQGSPAYYGGTPSIAYGGRPAYYGGGATQYGGSAYYYGNAPQGAEEGSMIGTLSVSRILRVISQRWLSVFVFLLIGLVVAFAVYRISPTIYEATSEFTMDMRRASGSTNRSLNEAMPDLGNDYAEIFNTRLSDWRSEKVITKIVQQYRANRPASTTPDSELLGALSGSKLELQRHSRLITISVRSRDPQIAAALANAYAEAIEAFTDEENKLRCDKAVQQIHGNVEKKRRDVEKLRKELLDFRTANKVDNLRSTRETCAESLKKTTGDILALETQETQLVEYEKLLEVVRKDPEQFGTLNANVARAQEIASEYSAFQQATAEYQGLLINFTENHPEVQAKKKLAETCRQRFIDSSVRALAAGRAQLNVVRNQLNTLRRRQEDFRNELASLEQRVVLAESSLMQLETDVQIANDVLKGLTLDENTARLAAETNNEIVRVGRPAGVPGAPVLPNPLVIFGAGVVMSLGLGILFVLVLDNLEDTVVNLADIEGRLSLKVLAVLPHVRRKKREEVAKFPVEDKYSQFAEAVAGLRNLLDSPRYASLSKCMLVISTQPGEGKSITSSSLAISYAQAGRKTLLVDFDLRRPRQARVWGVELTPETSFSHVLQAACEGKHADFEKVVRHSSVDGLDLFVSLPPDGVNPATILGSSVIGEFFAWARANYDRVIVDSPPYGLVGDVVSLAVMVDSAIIMCCPDRSHFKPIQYCSRCLVEAGANILGVIVNDVEISSASAFSPSSHHHGGGGSLRYDEDGKSGYGGYGYGYGYGGYAPRDDEEYEEGDYAPLKKPEKETKKPDASEDQKPGKETGKDDE